MSSIGERNRKQLLARVEGDPRLGGARVRAATALMRISIFATVVAAVSGAIVTQSIFGEGTAQFAVGMGAGYVGYFVFLFATMTKPRVLGAMAVLTDNKVVLLGSRKIGVVAEYEFDELQSIEMTRKGNLLRLGKLAIAPVDGERTTFFTSNRRQAADFVEQFEQLTGSGPG